MKSRKKELEWRPRSGESSVFCRPLKLKQGEGVRGRWGDSSRWAWGPVSATLCSHRRVWLLGGEGNVQRPGDTKRIVMNFNFVHFPGVQLWVHLVRLMLPQVIYPPLWCLIPSPYLHYSEWPSVPHGNRGKTSWQLVFVKNIFPSHKWRLCRKQNPSHGHLGRLYSGANATFSCCLVCHLWPNKRLISVLGSRSSLGVTD